MCQGFKHFSGFLHHFVLAKLATSSIRVFKRGLFIIIVIAYCKKGIKRKRTLKKQARKAYYIVRISQNIQLNNKPHR